MTLSRDLLATPLAAIMAIVPIMAIPAPVRAGADDARQHLVEDLEAGLYILCRNYGTIASTVMRARQQDRPRSYVMSTVRRATGTGALQDDARAMVEDAYAGPLYNTQPYIEDAVTRFRDRWVARCEERWTPVMESLKPAPETLLDAAPGIRETLPR